MTLGFPTIVIPAIQGGEGRSETSGDIVLNKDEISWFSKFPKTNINNKRLQLNIFPCLQVPLTLFVCLWDVCSPAYSLSPWASEEPCRWVNNINIT